MVSKKTVSFENSRFPKLGTVLKSFLHEFIEISKTQIRKVIRYLIKLNLYKNRTIYYVNYCFLINSISNNFPQFFPVTKILLFLES